MLPLWHQEVLIMMLGGKERVPTDISNDLNPCNGVCMCVCVYQHSIYPVWVS